MKELAGLKLLVRMKLTAAGFLVMVEIKNSEQRLTEVRATPFEMNISLGLEDQAILDMELLASRLAAQFIRIRGQFARRDPRAAKLPTHSDKAQRDERKNRRELKLNIEKLKKMRGM